MIKMWCEQMWKHANTHLHLLIKSAVIMILHISLLKVQYVQIGHLWKSHSKQVGVCISQL